MARKKLERYPNFGAVRQYVDDILGGRKVACKELIQACERFERDMQDPRWEFRPADAEFVIRII